MVRSVWVAGWCAGLVLATVLLPHSRRDAGAQSAAPAVTARFTAAADASVDAARPRSRHGASRSLSVRRAPLARAYLRFDVRLSGHIERATLRLYAIRGSKAGYQVRAVAPASWRESSLTYARAPPVARGRPVAGSGAVPSRAWAGVDVTALIDRSGSVTVAITTRGRRPLRLGSRESSFKPLLVVETTGIAGQDSSPTAPRGDTAPGVTAPGEPPPGDTAPGDTAPAEPGAVGSATPAPSATPVAPPAPPAYRFLYYSDLDPEAAASNGWNLVDAGSQEAVDAIPEGTRALVWVSDYDNVTCDWEIADAELSTAVEPMAADPKVAGFFFSDEPDPDACANAPAQHAARTRLLHALAPGKITVMVIDANSGQASLDQIPRWVGAADFVGLDPYPCFVGDPCDFAWIDAVIGAADRVGLSYWGVVQAFADSTWRWPTPEELEHMLSQWAASRQSGSMTFAWEWAGNALAGKPDLLSVLRRYNGLNATQLPWPIDTSSA